MTQTIDIPNAEAPELYRWLAEQVCITCKGKGIMPAQHHDTEPFTCLRCRGLGLASPWASQECPNYICLQPDLWGGIGYITLGGPGEEKLPVKHPQCNGSGRVPKEMGLSLIIVEAQKLGCYDVIADAIAEQVRSKWSTEGEITLAALRAFCTQAALHA